MVKKAKTTNRPNLNPKQELFCLYYTGELFANATMSYAAAYGMNLNDYSREPQKDEDGAVVEISEYQKHYMTCMVNGSKLLRMAKVKKRCDAIIKAKFNDTAVDMRHAELIYQREDANVSLGAIREFNRVRGRVKERETELPPGAAPITKIEIVMPALPAGRPKV